MPYYSLRTGPCGCLSVWLPSVSKHRKQNVPHWHQHFGFVRVKDNGQASMTITSIILALRGWGKRKPNRWKESIYTEYPIQLFELLFYSSRTRAIVSCLLVSTHTSLQCLQPWHSNPEQRLWRLRGFAPSSYQRKAEIGRNSPTTELVLWPSVSTQLSIIGPFRLRAKGKVALIKENKRHKLEELAR